MRDVSNTTGPISYGDASWEDGSSSTNLTGEAYNKDLIRRANTVPIINVFKHYGLNINNYNRKIVCPFTSHQGGRERSGSFTFYPDTNTYCCYGCGLGSFCCDFVSIMDGISKLHAAKKIINLFNGEVDDAALLSKDDFSKRMEIIMDFSNTILEFRQLYSDEKSYIFIEKICYIYDKANLRYKNVDNSAISRVIEELKRKIINYK